MNRKISFIPGHYYHIFNRGTEKRKIFLDEKDYRRFLTLLFLCNDTSPLDIREHFREIREGRTFDNIKRKILIDIGAYCLMPNHFHLLIKEKTKNGVTNFMRKLSTAYAMYFNKRNERSGNLFQGKFGAQLLDSDEYLKYIFAYTHLNPIKLIEPEWKEKGIKNISRAKNFLNKYAWSSYLSYTSKEKVDLILNKNAFPKYFVNVKEFNDFLEDWLSFVK